jgi:hypothetical protein
VAREEVEGADISAVDGKTEDQTTGKT